MQRLILQGKLLPAARILSALASLWTFYTSPYKVADFTLWDYLPMGSIVCASFWKIAENAILDSQRELDELKRMYLSGAKKLRAQAPGAI